MCLIVWDRKTAEREQERKTKRYKDRKGEKKNKQKTAEVICKDGRDYMPRRQRLYAKTAEVICQDGGGYMQTIARLPFLGRTLCRSPTKKGQAGKIFLLVSHYEEV